MDPEKQESWLKLFRARPKRAAAMAVVAVLLLVLAALFVGGYLPEIGRQLAAPAEPAKSAPAIAPPASQPDLTAVRVETGINWTPETVAPHTTLNYLRLYPGFRNDTISGGLMTHINGGDTPMDYVPKGVDPVQSAMFVHVENAGQTTLLDSWITVHVQFKPPRSSGGVVAADPTLLEIDQRFRIPKTMRPDDSFDFFIINASKLSVTFALHDSINARVLGEPRAREIRALFAGMLGGVKAFGLGAETEPHWSQPGGFDYSKLPIPPKP